jgi:hypothetical protein
MMALRSWQDNLPDDRLRVAKYIRSSNAGGQRQPASGGTSEPPCPDTDEISDERWCNMLNEAANTRRREDEASDMSDDYALAILADCNPLLIGAMA